MIVSIISLYTAQVYKAVIKLHRNDWWVIQRLHCDNYISRDFIKLPTLYATCSVIDDTNIAPACHMSATAAAETVAMATFTSSDHLPLQET